MKVNTEIPVRFEKVEDYDSRFQKVKIWLMHLGKNYNNSNFDAEVVIESMNTLKNTPILGYIEESRLGDKDFKGHELELVVEDGEVKDKYIGQAFGVIPENCNPRFEKKAGDTGELLDFLVVDGLLWTKFDDAISILNESGEVQQSMELHKEYDGYWDEEGYFNFTKFSFYGACMLGKNVSPAMQKASVEKVFSTNAIQDVITKKLEEFHEFSMSHSKEVEHQMTLEEILAKYSVTAESLTEKGIVVEDFTMEELEVKIQESFDTTDPEPTDPEPNPEAQPEDIDPEPEPEPVDPEPELENESKVYHKFALAHDDIRNQLYGQVQDYVEGNEIGDRYDFWISKVYDDHIILQDEYTNKLYKVAYSKDNDLVSLNSHVEVYASYLTVEEKGALELMRSNFEVISQENEELKTFQKDIFKAQHESQVEELFTQFSKLTDEDVADIKENVHQFTVEEVEAKLFELLGRKTATFSKKETASPSKIQLKFDSIKQERTSVDHFFEKHGIKR